MSGNAEFDVDGRDPVPQRIEAPFGAVLWLDDVEGSETTWLWPDRVPVGHVTVVAGESQSGKSLLAAEIAARVSRGDAWCDAAAKRSPGAVVIAHPDRHLNPVLKRRLLSAGADLRRLAVVNRDGVPAEGVTPAEALLAKLTIALDQVGDCALVVIDDLPGWLRTPGPRPDELAEVFDRLAELAARREIALVVVWRLEKKGLGGSGRALEALLDAAPVVWLVARDAYRPEGRLLVCAQNRFGRPAENLAFRAQSDRLVWQAATWQLTADEVVASFTRTVDRHERRQAGAWLLEMLAEGPIEANRLWEECRQCHLAERTVRRAAAELGLHPIKAGKSGPWLWGFDPEKAQPADDTPRQNVAAFDEIGSLPTSDVVQVELRRDAPPSVTNLHSVGSLPNSGVKSQPLSDDATPHAAQAFQPDETASAGGPDLPAGAAAPIVAAFDNVGSLPNSAVAEQNVPADAIAFRAAENGADDAEVSDVAAFEPAESRPNIEAAPPAAAKSAKQRRRRQRSQGEQKALDRFMDAIRNG